MLLPLASTARGSRSAEFDTFLKLPLLSSNTAMPMLPFSVNLIALPSRLMRIWRRRVGSPRSHTGTSGAISQLTVRFFSAAWGRMIDRALSITDIGRNGRFSSSSFPASIFDRSRMSLMIASSAPDDFMT